MQALEIRQKLFITSGLTIGQITVIDLVQDLYHHPAFNDTPRSYLKQGQIWECLCAACGRHFLISENILSRGESKSCGCLRRKKREIKWEQRQKSLALSMKRREINDTIRRLRFELAKLQLMPGDVQNYARIEQIGNDLRKAHATKASIAAQYHPNGDRKRTAKIIAKNTGKVKTAGGRVLEDWEIDAMIAGAKVAKERLGYLPEEYIPVKNLL